MTKKQLTLEELEEKYPDWIKEIKRIYNKDRDISWCLLIFFSISFVLILCLFFDFLFWLSLLYGLFGAFIMGLGSLRRLKSICLFCTTRFGYNNDLAKDMIKSSFLTEIGIYLIVLSVLGQALVYFKS